jgi:hypothetical protein
MKCGKCNAISGDEWTQCAGVCPVPGSPWFVADHDEGGFSLPPISLDGPHKPSDHRVWLARKLLDSKLTDEEAYGIVAWFPAVSDIWKVAK